jgi:hypothetical protein
MNANEWNEFVSTVLEYDQVEDAFERSAGSTSRVNRMADRVEAMKAKHRSSPDWPAWLEAMAVNPEPAVRLQGALELAFTDRARALEILDELESGKYGRMSSSARWARVTVNRSSEHKVSPETSIPTSLPPHPSTFDPSREATSEAVLVVHNAIMSGGLTSALDVAGDRFPDAILGYELIGLPAVANLLRHAVKIAFAGAIPPDPTERQSIMNVVGGRDLEALDRNYDELVPSDALLGRHLDAYLDGAP